MKLLHLLRKSLINKLGRNILFFLYRTRLKNIEKYKHLLNLLKSYSSEHRKFIEFLREVMSHQNAQFLKKKLKYFNYYEKKQGELKKNLKFLKKTKKGKELYRDLIGLLGIHQREREFLKKFLNAAKIKDEEMMRYYLFALEDLLKRDEATLKKFMDGIENLIKGKIN
ncbi:MAG: hypothetical protein ABDH49_01080 [Candidatus Hydrothermales bacterium]